MLSLSSPLSTSGTRGTVHPWKQALLARSLRPNWKCHWCWEVILVNCSPFNVHNSLSTIYCSPFIAHNLIPPFIAHHLLQKSTTYCPPFVAHRLPTIYCPLLIAHNLLRPRYIPWWLECSPFIAHNLLPLYLLPTTYWPLFVAHHLLTICCPPGTFPGGLSATLRATLTGLAIQSQEIRIFCWSFKII